MKNTEKITIGHSRAVELTKIALIAALYVVVTMALSVIGFGAVQIRLSEMFNYLPLFNKRYIWAVTLGVAIANLASPLGIIDVVVGSVSTFLVLKVVQYITKHMTSMPFKFVVTAGVFALSMFTVAGQLTLVSGFPFFATWLSVGVGELVSMAVGGILIYGISQKVDLTK